MIIDQSAVRAASQGRILILEGIEKAERNVLPVLNNLLENREMVCTKMDFSWNILYAYIIFNVYYIF